MRRKLPNNWISSKNYPDADLQCTELKFTYMFEEWIFPVIEQFCYDAVEQGRRDKDSGSISRRYYDGTKEHVKITVDFGGKDEFLHSRYFCEGALKDISDQCSEPHEKTNPWNVKAGGTYEFDGYKYWLEPQVERAPPGHAYGGGCRCTWNFPKMKEWKVWGHGWGGVWEVDRIREEIKGCNLNEGAVEYRNKIPSPGENIEWQFKFQTSSKTNKKCIQDALRKAGGPVGINKCTGYGG